MPRPADPTRPSLPPLYYLHNLEAAFACIEARYADLLDAQEQGFLTGFAALPLPSRALLARLLLRKGPYFRIGALRYAEIEDLAAALAPLSDRGFISLQPVLDLPSLFALLTRGELVAAFPQLPATQSKLQWQSDLAGLWPEARPLREWAPGLNDAVIALQVAALAMRLRLLFFGNSRQEWHEFVLTDLGILRYESVAFDLRSRPFQHRQDIESYYHLHDCRERLRAGVASTEIADELAVPTGISDWLQARYQRVQLAFGDQQQRERDFEGALATYRACGSPDAQLQCVKLLERLQRPAEAHAVATALRASRCSEALVQAAERCLARLCRRLGVVAPGRAPQGRTDTQQLMLPRPPGGGSVERIAAEHLARGGGEVFYVENSLLGSLFGLLYWDALFAPVPGAFFHPFQSRPADLYTPAFQRHRGTQLQAARAALDSGAYRALIEVRYREKYALQSAFVSWGLLTEPLLALALAVIPASHLRLCFDRMLEDLRENSSGLPDLIQFWPEVGRYRMIEVKGPGDRLQYNQRRWLEFFHAHALPVTVCHVSWNA